MSRFVKLLFLSALALVSCGQDEISLPDAGGGSTSLCGDWYPGATADGGAFDFAEGGTLACHVWDSVRRDGNDGYLHLGDLYLAAAHGEVSYRSVVFVFSARNCPTCHELISALAERKSDLEAANGLFVGVARTDLLDPGSRLDLATAETVLLDEDGWPASWMLTNDAEDHFPTTVDEFTPWVAVVRLSDMRIQVLSNERFAADNLDELASLLASY